MKRSVITIPLGQRKLQEVVRVESDDLPGPEDGALGFRSFWDFFTSLQTVPTILRHSVDCPIMFVIHHNGRSWVIETKATVDAPNPAQT